MSNAKHELTRIDTWLARRPASAPALPPGVLDAAIQQLPERSDEHRVAAMLTQLDDIGADADTLVAAVIHSTGQALPDAASASVRRLLEGQVSASRVWSIHASREGTQGAEGLRRLLLAIIGDLRVVLILLARQLVEMREAARWPEDQRCQLARLSADIHAPLANRLGIWQLKWELEDLAFRYLQPDTYKRIAHLLDEKRGDREQFIESAKTRLREALQAADIVADVAGRPKHIFSIWKKMQRKDIPFSDLYDIRAVRVLVDDVGDCYGALGVVHGLWTPVPSEFDDYIATPKGNNYRSLHTAVTGPQGKTLEVQIRTHQMHQHAELGVAAHWRYKEGGGADAEFERKIAWMRQLLDARDGDDEGGALLAGLSTELIEDRVYVLTPRGEVIDLPHGGTVLDFAYHVHTEVGHRCRGAKVNGRIVPLTFAPKSGDQIEILTSKTAAPKRDWLMSSGGYLKSARARDKVRAWFHKLDSARNQQEGRELLERELKRLALHQLDLQQVLPRFRLPRVEELYLAVALGDISPSQIARALHEASQPAEPEPTPAGPPARKPQAGDQGFTIEGIGNLMTQLARCCQPVAGDSILGYLTRGRGVSIHRRGCNAIQRLAARHPERILPVEWGDRHARSYRVDIQVRAIDRKWMLKDLTNVIGSNSAHILGVNSVVDSSRATADIAFSLKVGNFQQLGELLGRLAAVPGVSSVRRTAG